MEQKKLKNESLKNVSGGCDMSNCIRHLSQPSSQACAGCSHLYFVGVFNSIDGKEIKLYNCDIRASEADNGQVADGHSFPGLEGFP